MVTSSNVTFVDQISGIMGFGFPRLSTISNALPNGKKDSHRRYPFTNGSLAPPLFATMAQQGLLSYPLFGIHLPQNLSSTGSLSLGKEAFGFTSRWLITRAGAIDASIVTNRSLIEWNEVVPFAPIGSTSNVSSYLQWAIRLSGISVCLVLSICSKCMIFIVI